MTKRILVDAVHPEEVRVAVADDERLVEYEFETLQKKQIKSNIYLGKITRVEPSLQAAFVEYGGNRQGFLPFSEIHFDYYQIPTEDKERLNKIVQDERDKDKARESQEDDDQDQEEKSSNSKEKKESKEEDKQDNKSKSDSKPSKGGKSRNLNSRKHSSRSRRVELPEPFTQRDFYDLKNADELAKQFASELFGEDYVVPSIFDVANKEKEEPAEAVEEEVTEEEEPVTNEAQEDEEEIVEERRPQNSMEIYKQYKIQEVIKRNQVVLIQVVKEERGNKGASLTTYMALAGRYCVFMPNTEKGGGVSRRITSYSERKRIRNLLKAMEIPDGTSLIVRTAGMEKEDDEIKADFNYMKDMWNDIRKQTLESKAPALIYEESDIVRRSLRDLFKGDVSEVVIEGGDAFKSASKFIEAVAPGQKDMVKKHGSNIPIFQKFKIEEKLDDLYEPETRLESGGSIVIVPTEALVSIDVNSGKATKERSVEDTALKTNLEAAREISRQLRLRDLAGLVVIDFIDMRDVRNRKAVERELKDSVKNDRAKIQIGRISSFGLLEMSRQRMHSSLLESSSVCCPMCKGMGIVRSLESLALKVVRAIEGESGRKPINELHIYSSYDISKFLQDNMREELQDIEEKDDVTIILKEDYSFLPNQFEITTNKNTKRSLGNLSSAGRRISKKDSKPKNANADSKSEEEDTSDDTEKKKYDKSNKRKTKKAQKSPSKSKDYNKNDDTQDSSFNSSDEDDQGNVEQFNSPANDFTSEEEKDKSSKLKGLWKKITS